MSTPKQRRSEAAMGSSLPDQFSKGSGHKSKDRSFSLGIAKGLKNLTMPPLLKRNKDADKDAMEDFNCMDHSECNVLKLCTVCAKKPMRCGAPKHLIAGGITPEEMVENGLMELIHSIRNKKLYEKNDASVNLQQADDIVKRATEKAQEFDQERKYCMERYAPQDLTLYEENLASMGKFEWSELQTGELLGVGGFSNVLEICGFQLTNPYGRKFSKKEQVARKFLSRHATRIYDPNTYHSTASMGSSSSVHAPSLSGMASAGLADIIVGHRYALKHLRPKLAQIHDQRTFNCAAVDLIGEAQVLLSLQHPNIIKIRGFAAAGPEGYKLGKHTGYFLILDRLPETMERRLVVWRQKVKKYKSFQKSIVSKVMFQSNRETACRKLAELLHERYRVAAEICSAMEYLHDRRMINRDLKIANIGFDVRGDLKLLDFGLARWLPKTALTGDKANNKTALLDESFRLSSVGTKLYMAPEVMMHKPYSAKADVYSFGIVFWEMLCLSEPWWKREANDPADVREQMVKAPELIPLCPCWPQPVKHILQRCVSYIPDVRPSFTEIRQVFRQELFVTLEGDEVFGRPSFASIKTADCHFDDETDNNQMSRRSMGTSDGHHNHSRRSFASDGSSQHDEGLDAVGELSTGGANNGVVPRRRRSTYVLNFKDLAWLSSSSLRFGLDGSMKESSGRFGLDGSFNENSSSAVEGQRDAGKR